MIRTYVPEQVHKRVKKYAVEHSIPIVKAYEKLICDIVDENGQIRELRFPREYLTPISERAKKCKITEMDVIMQLIKTIQMLYEDEEMLKKVEKLIKILIGRAQI